MYYLWQNDAQTGPLTFAQLVEKWRARQVGPLTLYWEEGNADWLPLHNLAPLLDTPPLPGVSPTGPPMLPVAPPQPALAPGVTTDEAIAWNGHPSLWHWWGTIMWGILLAPLLVGIGMLIYVYCVRSATRFRVTNRRVSVETGLFSRASRELRIANIRSIGARANLFGLGQIDFSTAARDEAEVVFWGVPRVAQVRDLVKRLQNELR